MAGAGAPFAYVIGAFLTLAGPGGAVLHDTFVPSWPKTHDGRMILVALLGTTISPYLFFWQSSQEVEEEKAAGRRMLVLRHGATRKPAAQPPDQTSAWGPSSPI